eukprot:TRINITY_DN31844_c0_g1_i1.p1 TRINITY_DN31844_c0_g1~~TRINITY_DN31844_c0_g1_i1.p1  ORF type:complete len:112 (-),score=28.50 TRINITY_DN31844_c0_g1_i1:118-453(-)
MSEAPRGPTKRPAADVATEAGNERKATKARAKAKAEAQAKAQPLKPLVPPAPALGYPPAQAAAALSEQGAAAALVVCSSDEESMPLFYQMPLEARRPPFVLSMLCVGCILH